VNAWLVVILCGITGACAAEVLDLHTGLLDDGAYPWDRKYGGTESLGAVKYIVRICANAALGAAAALAVYAEDPLPGLVPHGVFVLGLAGFAAPAVLQKLGRVAPP
jgi:hypothetical protein